MYFYIIVYALPLWGRREEDNVFDFETLYIKGEYVLQLKKKISQIKYLRLLPAYFFGDSFQKLKFS